MSVHHRPAGLSDCSTIILCGELSQDLETRILILVVGSVGLLFRKKNVREHCTANSSGVHSPAMLCITCKSQLVVCRQLFPKLVSFFSSDLLRQSGKGGMTNKPGGSGA